MIALDMETALRHAAAMGLTHLTMWPVPSADGKTVFWKARATPSTAHGYVEHEALDPVEALARALHLLPHAKKRAMGKEKTQDENQGTLPIDAIPGKETEDGSVTAAVKPGCLKEFLPGE